MSAHRLHVEGIQLDLTGVGVKRTALSINKELLFTLRGLKFFRSKVSLVNIWFSKYMFDRDL